MSARDLTRDSGTAWSLATATTESDESAAEGQPTTPHAGARRRRLHPRAAVARSDGGLP